MTNPGGTNPEGSGPMTGPDYPGSPYQSQTTLQLQNIDFTKFPVTNDNLVDNVTKLNGFADYISKYMLTMQEGIDQSQENPIQQVQGLATNLVSLFGNGQLLSGIDLGDLGYYLPAIGALLGFNQTDPFPINLFDAAEQFFLGYVIPLTSFSTTINNIVGGFLQSIGIDADFISSIEGLVSAFGSIAVSVEDFVNDVMDLLSVFGISSGDLGPFTDLWGAVSDLFGGNSLTDLTNIVNPIFHDLAPWITDLATAVGWIADIINDFGSGIDDPTAIANLTSMFTGVLDLLPGISNQLISNTNFTSGTTGWDITPMSDVLPGGDSTNAQFNPTWNSTVGNAAPGCIQFEGTGNSWCMNTDMSPVNAGDVVQASGTFSYADLGTNDGAGGSPTVTIQIAEYTDVEQDSGDYSLLRYIGGTSADIQGSSDSAWSTLSISSSYTVSSDATNIEVIFSVYMPNGGEIYIDDFSLTDSSDGIFDVNDGWAGIFNNFLGGVNKLLNVVLGIPSTLLTSDSTQNLLANPLMTSSSSPWVLSPTGTVPDFLATWNDAYGDDSTQPEGSIQFSGETNSWAYSEEVTVVSGQSVSGSATYVYNAVGAGTQIILEFDEYSNSAYLRTIGSTTITVDGSDNTWTPIATATNYVASSDATYVTLRVAVHMPGGGTVNFSNFSLTKSGGIADSLVPGISNIIASIASVFGVDEATTYTDLMNSLQPVQNVVNWVDNFVTELFGSDSDVSAIGTSLANFGSLFSGIDWTDFNVTQAWDTIVTNFISEVDSFYTAVENVIDDGYSEILSALGITSTSGSSSETFSAWLSSLFSTADSALTSSSPLDAGNLWGLLPTTVYGNVPATAISAAASNPLLNPDFETVLSLSPGGGWSWDSTVYYNPPVGDTSPGSALVTANNLVQGLRSNLMSVSGGQSVAMTIQTLVTDLVSTGDCLDIDVVTYLGSAVVSTETVASIVAPTGGPSGWVNAPAGSSAGEISGTFTVPDDGSVDGIKMRLVVDDTATSGSIRFGAATCVVSGGLIPSMQDDITTLQTLSTESTAATTTFWQSVFTAFTTFVSNDNWTTYIATLESAYQTYITTETTLVSGEFATLQQILNSLLGLNSSTGLFSLSSISSALGNTNLGSDVSGLSSILTSFLSLFDSSQSGVSSTSSTAFWTSVINEIINPLNLTQTQSSNVVVSTGNSLINVFDNLFDIGNDPTTAQVQGSAVSGAQGVVNVWDSITSIFDSLVSGFTQSPSSGASSAQVAAAASAVTQIASTALAQSAANTNVLNTINNQPGIAGLDNTAVSNMPLTAIDWTAGTGVESYSGSWVRCPQANIFTQFAFAATEFAASSAVTNLVVYFYKLNQSTGGLTYITNSGNVASQVPTNSTTPAWVRFETSAISVDAGDVLIALPYTSSGHYAAIYGINPPAAGTSSVPNDASKLLQNIGVIFTPSGSSNIAKSSLSWNGTAPYIVFEVVDLPPGYYPPITYTYDTPGTEVIDIPSWANYVDRIVLGAGGGGGGLGYGAGSNGGASSATLGSSTLTGAGGVGGIGGTTTTPANSVGGSPGTDTYSGVPYTGGQQVYYQQNGLPPGGAGGGGYTGYGVYGYGGSPPAWEADTQTISGETTMSITVGAGGAASPNYGAGAGASGEVILVFRQS